MCVCVCAYVRACVRGDVNTLPSSSVNVGEDCPVFDGLYEFCQLSCGGSIGKNKTCVGLCHQTYLISWGNQVEQARS